MIRYPTWATRVQLTAGHSARTCPQWRARQAGGAGKPGPQGTAREAGVPPPPPPPSPPPPPPPPPRQETPGQGTGAHQGPTLNPRGEPGPPGQLPRSSRCGPWLNLIFEAWTNTESART